MNMRFNQWDCAVTFIGRGGMTVPNLRSEFDEIVSRGPNVLYIWRLVLTLLVDGTLCV